MQHLEDRRVPASMLGLTPNNELVAFDSATPGTTTVTAITGLQVGETVLGIDYRPATEQLFAITNLNQNLYTIDAATGAATLVGSGGGAFTGTALGIDFNPTVDRLRLVSNTGENLRANPNNGQVTVDSAINGDVTKLAAVAYTNNFAGAAKTTLYGIDADTDQVVIFSGATPNDGTTSKLSATLGFDTDDNVGFDIGIDGAAFATLTVAGATGLYSIDLTTGAATFVGAVGAAAIVLSDVTVVPDTNAPPFITTTVFNASYVATDPGVVINPSGQVGDPDSPNFNGGNLTVAIINNADADDMLEVNNQGTGAGQIGVSGTDVTFEGTVIGTLAGGSGATPLVVVFNTNATPAVAQALMRQITYRSVSPTPPVNTRTVQFSVTDDQGAVSNLVTRGVDVTIDTTPPYVLSITRKSANPTNADTVDFTVLFSEAVTGVDATDFQTVVLGSVTGATVTNVFGSDTSWTVSVTTTGGTGALALDLIDDDSIVDLRGNPLGDDQGGTNGDFTKGEAFDIDRTVPTVVSIVRAGANPTFANSVDYTVTFSESVTGVDAADFALVATGGVSGSTVTNVAGSGKTYTVTVNTGTVTGTGTLRLDLVDDDTILDLATNPLGGTGAGNGDFTTGEAYDLEVAPPVVLSIVRADADPTNAQSVNFTVTFDRDVTGVDTTDFFIVGGVVGATVTGVTGGAKVYTVTVDTGTGDGLLTLNLFDDDSIVDGNGNKLGGTGTGNGDFGGESYTLDRTAPSVTSITVVGPATVNAGPVTFDVTFSEDVTGVDVGDFLLDLVGPTGATVTGVTGSGKTYSVTVDIGTGEGTIQLRLADDDSILDAAGNPLGGAGAGNGDFNTGDLVTIDLTAPTVVSITRLDPNPSDKSTVSFKVTFSEAVTGVDAADFTLFTTGTLAGGSVTGVTGTGTEYTVTINAGTGDGTVRLDLIDDDSILDTAGNALGGAGAGNGDFTTGEVYTIAQPPVVISSILASKNPTNATQVDFTVTFSEPVTGVSAFDFAFNTTGTLGGVSFASITGSGAVYTITVNVLTGDGTLRLDVLDNDTIIDADGNPLGGVGVGNGEFKLGETYTIDRIAPVPTISLDVGQADPATGEPINFLVTFNEDVTGFDAADVTVGGTVGGTATVTAIDARTYRVTITGSTGPGTVTITIADGAAEDLAGNASAPAVIVDNSVTIQDANQPPAITAPTNVAATEDTVFNFTAGSISISDPDAGTAEVQVTLTVTGGTVTLGGTAGLTFITGDGDADAVMTFKGTLTDINTALNSLRYNPTLNFNGPASLTIDVDDLGNTGGGGPQTATATVTIDVAAVNDAPTIEVDPLAGDQFTDEDVTFTFPDTLIKIDDVDAGDGILQLSLTATNGTLTLGSLANLTFVTGDGTDDVSIVIQGKLVDLQAAIKGLQFNPTPNFNGAANVLFVLNDQGNTGAGGPLSATLDQEITVRAVNDGPTVTAPTAVTVAEDGSISFTGANQISVSDIDAENGTIKVSLVVFAGTVTLSGTTGLTFTAGDGTGDASMTFTGTLANVNAALNGLTYTPRANFNGAEALWITADDQGNTGLGTALSDTRTVNITVTAANDAPTAVNDSFTTSQNTRLVIEAPGILANDTDPEGDLLSAILVTDVPAGSGRLTFGGGPNTGNGGFVFEPATNFVGTVTFQYRASDGTLQSNIATVTITVTPRFTRLHATGAGAGGSPHVLVYNEDSSLRFSFNAFDPKFTGGVAVATGDVNGDGVEDIICAAGPGGGPHVVVYSGVDASLLSSFAAFPGEYTFGLNVAAGDITGDGIAEVVIGAGKGGTPNVRVFDARTGQSVRDFFAYDVAFKGGVSVAVGEYSGDNRGDIVTGAGAGGSPHVIIYDGASGRILQSFLAFDSAFAGGVNVAAGQFNGKPSVFAAAGPGGVPTVAVFDTTTQTQAASFFAFAQEYSGGVRIGSEVGVNGKTTLFLSRGPGVAPSFRSIDADTFTDIQAFNAYDPAFLGGVFVG